MKPLSKLSLRFIDLLWPSLMIYLYIRNQFNFDWIYVCCLEAALQKKTFRYICLFLLLLLFWCCFSHCFVCNMWGFVDLFFGTEGMEATPVAQHQHSRALNKRNNTAVIDEPKLINERNKWHSFVCLKRDVVKYIILASVFLTHNDTDTKTDGKSRVNNKSISMIFVTINFDKNKQKNRIVSNLLSSWRRNYCRHLS